jgi:hypothetical protein
MALGAIFGFLKPVFGIIDKSVKDKDLAAKLKHDIQLGYLNMDKTTLESQTSIIVAEAQGESWIQRNWRPVTMLSFVGFIGSYWLGLAPEYLVVNPDVVEKLFGLVQIGLGGYVVGRTGEKMMKTYKEPELEKAKRSKSKDDDGAPGEIL